jgi:hypothetical protein
MACIGEMYISLYRAAWARRDSRLSRRNYPLTSPPSIGINRAGHTVREVGRQELNHPDTILDDSEPP